LAAPFFDEKRCADFVWTLPFSRKNVPNFAGQKFRLLQAPCDLRQLCKHCSKFAATLRRPKKFTFQFAASYGSPKSLLSSSPQATAARKVYFPAPRNAGDLKI
jgi:hypothetical protein